MLLDFLGQHKCYSWKHVNRKVYCFAGTGNYDVLNQVELPIIPDSYCIRRDWYGSDFLPATTFCAGYPQGGKDSCGVSPLYLLNTRNCLTTKICI